MKKTLIFLTISGLLVLSACHDVSIQNGNLHWQENAYMQVYPKYYDNTICKGFITSDVLITNEFTTDRFMLTDIRNEVNDSATVFHLTGKYKKGAYEIIKNQTITALTAYPDMLVFETYYVNTSKASATVNAWENHKLQLSPAKGDSVLWSFQPSSTNLRKDWILPIERGFSQRNYLGMNNCDYGGGMPIVGLWNPTFGVAVGVAEPVLCQVSMPVQWSHNANYATMAVRYDYQQPQTFAAGDTLRTFNTFVIAHQGDYFNALRTFSNYMQTEQNVVLPKSQPGAFEAVWCAWGYERTFTMDEVLGTLPKVKELGFKWVDVDDGYQIAEGDWETNERFPGGDKDMRRLTNAIHSYGLQAKLWWAPLAADLGTNALKKHPEMQLVTEEYAPEFITWWDSYYLSPVNPTTKAYTADLVHRFLVTWDFDGLKMDGQHLNCCLPDHNPDSELEYPEQAVELLPSFYKNIYDQSLNYKENAVLQICPCGCATNYFLLPYMNQAVASDPTSSWQIRLKRKTYAAAAPDLAYYADHMELSDGGCDLATQIGIGGVVGSKFTWPKDNPNVKEKYVLTPEKEALLKKWVAIYNENMLSTGEYLNLYDIGFDKPETHVIRKNGAMYYAFYADKFNGTIELRGLDTSKQYTACEYTADDKRTFTVDGANPNITISFAGSYLLKVE